MADASDSLACLGVIPVFFNAGAALLPAILGGLASVAAILLKPRELVALCKRRPMVPVTVVACLALVGLAGWWWFTAPPPARAARAGKSGRTDWFQVAVEILQDRERARALGAAAPNGPRSDETGRGTPPPAAAPRAAPPSSGPSVSTAPGRALIFRGDASRCGYGGGRAPLKLAPLWVFSAADSAMCLSSPIVAGEVVYGASCLLDPPGNYGAVFCLDAATGRKRWQVETMEGLPAAQGKEFNGFFSSPAVSADGKYLVIGQGLHADADCALLCFDARTGRMLWNVPTPLHVEGSPAIDGDVAVAGAGAIEVGPDHQARGDPGYVLAVRLSDGKQLWKYPVNDPESSPAIRDGVAYIGSGLNGSHLVALRIESDEDLKTSGRDRLVWKVPTPYPATGTVTLADDLVLLGCGNGDYVVTAADPKGAVVAFDRATGAVRWQEDVADAVLGPIAVRDSVAVCPIRNGEVVALDLKKPSGGSRLLWRQRVSGRAAVLAGCAFTGTHVYAVSNDGYLAVLDAGDGKVLERHYLNAKDRPGEMGLTLSSPFVVNGRVYVGSETGGLRCFTGTEAP